MKILLDEWGLDWTRTYNCGGTCLSFGPLAVTAGGGQARTDGVWDHVPDEARQLHAAGQLFENVRER